MNDDPARGEAMSRNEYRERSWTSPRTEVRPSPIQAQGVFAREPILAGEVVEIIGGTAMTQAEFEAFLATAKRYNAVQIAEDAHLVERPEVTEARCGSLNHSCDSNLWMSDEATVVARRDIAAGEELTWATPCTPRIPSGSWTACATAALRSVVAPYAGATGGYGSFETGTGTTSPPSSTSG